MRTMQIPSDSELMVIMKRIPERMDRFELEINESAFWEFETEYKGMPVGTPGTTVREEVKILLGLAAEAVMYYDLLRKDMERIENYREAVRQVAVTTDIRAFLDATRVCQMKALWLNRICRNLTGNYFFTGKLSYVNGHIMTEEAYALVYQIFHLIG